MKFNVKDIEFTSHSGLMDYIRNLKLKYIGTSFLDNNDFLFMKEAVAFSDKFDGKPDIVKINFDNPPGYPMKSSRSIYCYFSDGTKDFVSMKNLKPGYRKRDKEAEYKRDIINALRFHVKEWKDRLLSEYTKSNGLTRHCTITGKWVRIEDCEVHHVPSFKSISTDFLNRYYAKNSKPIEIFREDRVDFQLKNEKLKDLWIRFHNKIATGVVLTVDEHKYEHSNKG